MRRFAILVLGVVWMVFGAIYLATDEPSGVLGHWWEDVRGLVWVAAGCILIASAAYARADWPLVLAAALAGERIAILAYRTLTDRPLVNMNDLAALASWCCMFLAVIVTIALPPPRDGDPCCRG